MASLRLENIKKNFGDTEIIKGVDVSVDDGEFVVLVGPSGCGKSTLLRMIAGLEDITGGDLYIGDRIVNDVPPKSRDLAMVFQNYALYPHMTVAKNMGFSLRLSKMPAAEIQKRVVAAARILDLEPLLSRLPRQLSGGQRQRVAMGRAIVRDPQVFLFDEPLSNLDAKLRVHMRSEIKELHQRLGSTMIYVTHDQIEAMTMADKIVVLQGGLVEQIGMPLDLYDKPDNMFVAGFIGSPAMNFVKGKITGGKFCDTAGHAWPIPAAFPDSEGRPVILGIRPEHIQRDTQGVRVQIQLTEPTGSETLVAARAGDVELKCLFRDRLPVQSGDVLDISIAPGLAHFFDPQTGRRLS
jgi:multiple sugar transport system ATP-binding protein